MTIIVTSLKADFTTGAFVTTAVNSTGKETKASFAIEHQELGSVIHTLSILGSDNLISVHGAKAELVGDELSLNIAPYLQWSGKSNKEIIFT